MARVTHTVVRGDTLSEIAQTYGTTVSALMQLNNISNPDYIVVGQVLIISLDAGETAPTKSTNNSNMAKIGVFGLQAGTDRTVFAEWIWDKEHTENYEVKWMYATGNSIGFIGNKSTVDEKQDLYTAPEIATHVAFYVRPISKTYTVNEQETSYWTAEWSTRVAYYFRDNPPSKPPAPDVDLEGLTLVMSLANLDINADKIEFEVVYDDTIVFDAGTAEIFTSSARLVFNVSAGHRYKARCRGIRDGIYGEWSEYSSNVFTPPEPPKQILELRALSETSVYLDWNKSDTATSYEVEYAERKSRFDSSNETQSLTVDATVSHAEVTGLESGREWFFRVRAINDEGESSWTAIKSVKLGVIPSSPTTWSSTSTAIVGESLKLYWIHNSEDGSKQTEAQLEQTINGLVSTTVFSSSELDAMGRQNDDSATCVFSINTASYQAGAQIKWRVRTKGILDVWGDWSIQRTVDIYAPPVATMSILNTNGLNIGTLRSFPFRISASGGPSSQTPIGYHVSITANSSYETVDNVGNHKMVVAGEEVYSKFFDISTELLVEISAGDVNLSNNISYTITCTVSMNSGLTATNSKTITVAWADVEYHPNVEIMYNPNTYSTSIRPYCENNSGTLVPDVTLSVYRREFNGDFTELATGLDNLSNTFVTDPHPSLDFARYRVVAISDATGEVSYYDVPGYPIGEKVAIIQWGEQWSNFDVQDGEPSDVNETPSWAGSLLVLKGNIDISDSHSSDLELVEYIGRKHPVSYYGTQLGETSSWNMEIDKQDKETLYALRRLGIWMGDVYVREPSGSGYWANVSVSFSQKHLEVTIPVTLDIKRVSGGV